MERFKLTNLRGLSTEEQMNLNGGIDVQGCTCKCTCTCEDKAPKSSQKSAANDVADGVKKKLEK